VSRARRASRGPRAGWNVAHHEQTLDNGLRVIVVPRKAANRAVVSMLLRVGSRFETSATNGISHFLEHMLYRGSPSLHTAHDQALAFETLGASLYAATQSDYGTMSLGMPPVSLADAFAIFAEVVKAPRFSAIEVERGIVREEILEDLDEEGRQIDADNLVREVVFGSHPLGFTITGSPSQLDRFDRAALKRHHARHYNASNAVLCFAGAVEPSACFRLAKRHLSDLKKGKRIAAELPPPPQAEARMRHVPNVSSQTTLRVAFRALSDRDPREPALEMLLRVLDDGMSTRLYERICDDKGLCYDVGALYEAYEDDGVFDVAAEVQHERVVDVVREVISVLSDLAEHGPTADEISRAKQRHRWQTEAMRNDADSLGSYYAHAALLRLAPTPLERHEQLAGVTAAEVRDVADSVFRAARSSLVTVGNLTQAQEGALRSVVDQLGRERE
jgi:predicted Zn-dependent peptidase